ncbi:MAG: hypothetical protein ACI3ZN_07700 [Candidatus Cryptobacteroides sp.]
MIRDEIIVHCIPKYYDQNKGDAKECDIQEVLDEAKRRGYHATKGSGCFGITATIEIDGIDFSLIPSRFANLAVLCNGIIPGKLIEVPPMDADGLLDLMEDIDEADVCLKDHILRYLSLLGGDFDISLNSEARYFSSLPSTTSSAAIFSYMGLPALAVYFQDQGLEPEDILTEVRMSCSKAEVKSTPYLKDPETFLRRCALIQEVCKKNSLVEHIAENSVIEVLKKFSPKGIVDMSEVKYACYDSGVILLAPYKRKSAIIGFLDYSKLSTLEDTISRIISYKEGSTLPEGFVLYE